MGGRVPKARCVPRHVWQRRVREENRSLDVHIIGVPYHIQIEPHPDESEVDHVWFDVEVPPCGRVRLSVNTLSKFNLRAGFDPRMRLACITSTYEQKPEPVLEESLPLDYRVFEAEQDLEYVPYEQGALEAFLLERGHRALRVEGWGELYIRHQLGVHQFHSRRASCAVPVDTLGRDGALKLYYPDRTAEMLLFKFCGQ